MATSRVCSDAAVATRLHYPFEIASAKDLQDQRKAGLFPRAEEEAKPAYSPPQRCRRTVLAIKDPLRRPKAARRRSDRVAVSDLPGGVIEVNPGLCGQEKEQD